MATWESNGQVTDDVKWLWKSRSWPQYAWCPLSRKWLVIATSDNGVPSPIGNGPWESNGNVTDDVAWPWKFKVVTPNILRTQYLGNGWRQRLGNNAAPTGNSHLGIEWLRDRWRHVTLKGQGHHPNMFGAYRPASRCGTETWPDLRLKSTPCRPPSTWSHSTWLHFTSLDSSMWLESTSNDFTSSELMTNLCK